MDDRPNPQDDALATDETPELISSGKVVGTAVYNRKAELLGSIYGLMLNKLNGRVAYAVMSFGGFLGIGDAYYPLPWKLLVYDTRLNGYVVDLDAGQLEAAPRYTDEPDWAACGRGIDLYYGSLGFSV
ncbi:MAG: PRC-barrel domain-containing protein [Alphaproteobacteria bacterium]|nr:PRC-barrel domain-containing protein [Alphaproteobacteria bacterium]